jgi:alanyl-tRNA synthetase
MLGNFSFGDYFKEKAIFYPAKELFKINLLVPSQVIHTKMESLRGMVSIIFCLRVKKTGI